MDYICKNTFITLVIEVTFLRKQIVIIQLQFDNFAGLKRSKALLF